MTVQTSDMARPRGSLRRRMIAGLGVFTVLILLAGAFFFWQLNELRGAIQDLREQDDRLALALNTAHQETNMLAVIQSKTIERIPAIFIEEMGAAVRALEARRDELSGQLPLLPEGDPMRDRIEGVTESLQNTIDMAEGSIRDVEGGDWPAAEARAALLLERHGDVGWQVYQLVALARERRIRAEARANEAMARMVSISVPLVVAALVVAVVIVLITVRSIAVGVEQLSHSAQRLAERHFEERIPVVRQDELGQLARTFNAMAEELQGLYAGLERQVAERTADLEGRSAQLETAAQVAREAAAIRDVGQLLDVTVRLISERFGFYHAGLFLVDEAGDYAVLQVASSEGGQRMLARGHKLKVGEEGIVGYAAGTGRPRVALDVGADAVFFDNPDLPDTRSELALPLKVRERVIGVLDVQSTQKAAFSEENVAILQTMADQVALAIVNARLLEESERALRELEALYGRQVREAWREREARQPAAYRYTGVAVEAVPPSAPEPVSPAPHRQPVVVQEEDGRRLVVSIRLRGQTLGSIALRQDVGSEPWSDEEIATVEELSTQIGLALENARLLEETRQRAEREQLAGEITAKMQRANDMDALMQNTIQELLTALNASYAAVHLGTEDELLSRLSGGPPDQGQ
jgi:GAF domain-containing protein